MRDRDERFHQEWLGLAQPIEGLVFSVPVLADAQIAPDVRPDLAAQLEAELVPSTDGRLAIASLAGFFERFLDYTAPRLVPRANLPAELSFYAPEGGQEIRPSFALARGPFAEEDPLAEFGLGDAPATDDAPPSNSSRGLTKPPPHFVGPRPNIWALAWDLRDDASTPIDKLDAAEDATGPWRYPPTAKLERLLRHTGIPIGFLCNGPELRLVYAPTGETSAHLTFRVNELREPAGRPILAALDLLLHARRAYGAAPEHTLEGLLAESRRRQADVTDALAKQVFEAVEILVAGFEAAAARDATGDRLDWLRPALEAEGDHFYQGVLSVVLRLVFLLYAEDQSLLPVEHPTYAAHLSVNGLYERLTHDAGAHPESMHHRFGAYGHLLALFRAVYFGVQHGSLDLPPRRGRLFDPNAYPFLEGGQPDWTAAVGDASARSAATPPSVDDGTIQRVLQRLVVFEGQRLSYRTLDVEQIGSVYESLMGYHVQRLESPAVRVGKLGVWVELDAVRALSPSDRARFLKEQCALNPGPIQAFEKALKEAGKDKDAALNALCELAQGKKADILKHRATAGRLVLQPGEERRRTGSHYTPRSLTEKVVKRTLEPLLACLGPANGDGARTAEQILQLKICDPAMGSGAFLVAACRELATEIVAAWTRTGELAPILEAHGDAHLHARRLVAQRCLYGVDKNPAAVELAKLSLWLITLSKRLPFTFVDHALRHGDSLVGLDFKQIAAFHWAPEKQVDLCQALLQDALDQAVELRQQIQALADHDDPSSQADKRRLFEFSQQAIDRIRTVADACIGAFFAETKDAPRERERKRRQDLVAKMIAGDPDATAELSELAAKTRKQLAPFHWWIEFPEVFFEARPDPLQGGIVNGAALMEGVVGNPPFMGGKQISGAFGNAYRDWLLMAHSSSHGNADLSAHFFRRAASLLGEHGAMGLISTNTIAQGDTRASGLRALVVGGFRIYDAVRSFAWPGSAAVTVTIVHLSKGAAVADTFIDGQPVASINSLLRSGLERAEPAPLRSNEGLCSSGSKIYGQGFVLSCTEREAILAQDRSNTDRIFPYLGGEEVNSDPGQLFDRYVISFHDMSIEEIARWPVLKRIVEERVKPERERLRGDNASAETLRRFWWRYQAHRPELYDALARMGKCLVTAQVSKHLFFSFQPTDRILSDTLYVFPLDHYAAFAVLQSRVHEPWARLLSSSLEDRLRYSASDCFETFPFPRPDPRTVLPDLETAGQALYEARAQYMIDTQQGLTKTYNAIKDPACEDPRILELRRLHEDMDRAVLAAYAWPDIPVPPYCPLTPADKKALQTFEDEIIDRLYLLNAERAQEEARAGKSKEPATKVVTAAKGKGRGKKGGDGQEGLF